MCVEASDPGLPKSHRKPQPRTRYPASSCARETEHFSRTLQQVAHCDKTSNATTISRSCVNVSILIFLPRRFQAGSAMPLHKQKILSSRTPTSPESAGGNPLIITYLDLPASSLVSEAPPIRNTTPTALATLNLKPLSKPQASTPSREPAPQSGGDRSWGSPGPSPRRSRRASCLGFR